MNKWSGSFLIGLSMLVIHVSAQDAAHGFQALSRPEKCWVVAHPFKAKYAYRVSLHVRKVCDSLENAGILMDGNGGQLDAFRHAYWMAKLVQHMSSRKARKLGRAHEKGNYLAWKKGGTEDGGRADSLMCDMDLKNNDTGIKLGKLPRYIKPGDATLISETISLVIEGKLVMMKKDESGNFYDCNGEKIETQKYSGKWYIPKCEVNSNAAIKRG